MPLPNFLCIGAQKAGTSWLYAQLISHPEVWMPPLKEMQYFNHLYVPQHRAWTSWHIRQGAVRAIVQHVNGTEKPNLGYVRYLADLGSRELFTDAWYRAAFDRPGAEGRKVGDVTPEYSTIPEAGIAHLRALLGAVKIIYLIRAPLARALSQLRMNVARQGKAPSDEFWRGQAEGWDIVNRGDYRAYVPRWKAAFAPEDLLFLPYGRIGAGPEALMREVEGFLGIGRHDYPRLRERVHASRGIDVPGEIAARVAARIDGQDAFIAAEFGEDFAAAT
ncbi:hypothetical protein BH23PSE1_BH23PSE1_01530 [soil metagenome]